MTSDSHVRIYASGEGEILPAMQDWRKSSQDPEEDRKLAAESWAECEKVARLLEEKGFGIG